MGSKEIKPSEYPERMLKALVKEYDMPENASIRANGMALAILAAEAGIVKDYETQERISNTEVRYSYDNFFPEIVATLGLMERAGWVEKRGSAADLCILPTVEGLCHGRFLNRSWCYREIWHPIKSDVRTVFIAIIIVILTSIVINLIF
jgi:hypothetical protein